MTQINVAPASTTARFSYAFPLQNGGIHCQSVDALGRSFATTRGRFGKCLQSSIAGLKRLLARR
jgi:hypothetical protein